MEASDVETQCRIDRMHSNALMMHARGSVKCNRRTSSSSKVQAIIEGFHVGFSHGFSCQPKDRSGEG